MQASTQRADGALELTARYSTASLIINGQHSTVPLALSLTEWLAADGNVLSTAFHGTLGNAGLSTNDFALSLPQFPDRPIRVGHHWTAADVVQGGALPTLNARAQESLAHLTGAGKALVAQIAGTESGHLHGTSTNGTTMDGQVKVTVVTTSLVATGELLTSRISMTMHGTASSM